MPIFLNKNERRVVRRLGHDNVEDVGNIAEALVALLEKQEIEKRHLLCGFISAMSYASRARLSTEKPRRHIVLASREHADVGYTYYKKIEINIKYESSAAASLLLVDPELALAIGLEWVNWRTGLQITDESKKEIKAKTTKMLKDIFRVSKIPNHKDLLRRIDEGEPALAASQQRS